MYASLGQMKAYINKIPLQVKTIVFDETYAYVHCNNKQLKQQFLKLELCPLL